MSLATGTRLGPYEIVALVGADPTGEVYHARDARNERNVAIKTFPANDPGARARLKERALAVAQLKHPHICGLHEVGHEQLEPRLVEQPIDAASEAAPIGEAPPAVDEIDFLVLEYLEGQTLETKLQRGALSLREAVTIAIAIADALDTAHGKGILHRDLRPSNVMLTKDGAVKLLNCGLADAPHVPLQGVSSVARTVVGDATDVATVAAPLEYAAPEQLEGLSSDARSDLFALGVLLFEMVTGTRAFQGKNQTLLIAAIMSLELEPLSKVRPGTPAALDHVVDRCLEKSPEDRWQTAHDLGVQLRWIAEGGAVLPASMDRWKLALRLGVGAAIVLILGASVTGIAYVSRRTVPEPLQFRVPVYGITQSGMDSAISPNGELIAVVARPDPPESAALYVRSVRSPTFRRIAGTDDAAQPFWSPDSRSIGFVIGGRLKRVDAAGGPPQNIAAAPGFTGGAWSSDGTIVYGSPQGLFQVLAEGGTSQQLTKVQGGETGHYWPAFRSDGRHYTYLTWSSDPTQRALYVASIGSSDRKKLMALESNVAHAPGYLLYHRDATLFAHAFDDEGLQLTGEPLHVIDELAFNSANGRGAFDVSQQGSLLYYQGQGGPSGRAQVNVGVQFGWRDHSGGQSGIAGDAGTYGDMDLSPDGKLFAVTRQEPGNAGADIWIIDWQRGAPTRLTLDPSDDVNPVWSNDGKRVAFTTFRKGNADIYVKNANGVGPETPLVDTTANEYVEDWSKDGRFLAYKLGKDSYDDLYVLPLTGDEKKPIPFVEGAFRKDEPQFSYDGKWIAYVSDESGTFQVYVIDFPGRKERHQASTIGGGQPRWDASGKRLYYRGPDNAIMEVDVPSLLRGDPVVPQRLFFVPPLASAQDQTRHQMSVIRDGSQFLVRYPNTGGNAFLAPTAPGTRGAANNVPFNFTPAGPTGQITGAGRGNQFSNNPPLGLTVIRDWIAFVTQGAK